MAKCGYDSCTLGGPIGDQRVTKCRLVDRARVVDVIKANSKENARITNIVKKQNMTLGI